MHHYISKEVVCPFYSQESETVIFHSEGVSKVNRVHLSFRGKNNLLSYREIYCKTIDGYQICPVYKMLAAKYGEGDG